MFITVACSCRLAFVLGITMFRLARTSRASLSRSFHSGTPLWKIVSFKLPDIGEGIAEGTERTSQVR